MLLHLSIRDFAIVDRLELEFRTGFTVLTGETGAGKSILIDALSLTLGDRAGSEQARSAAERADVSADLAIAPLPQETAGAHREWQRLRSARLDHEKNRAARDAEREQLDWQLEELSRLALAPGEWETIQSEHGRLAHAATLMEGVRDAIDSLSE